MEANPFALANAATHQMNVFGPPKAGFSRPLDVVMLHLWSAGKPPWLWISKIVKTRVWEWGEGIVDCP